MIGRPSPSARAREAKLCRMSWMRTSWSPARARMVSQAPSMSVMCLPGLAPGMTQRLPGLGGRASRTRTADGDKWTVRAPVFPSTMRISALSRSTCSQRRVRISFRRQPVSISKRIVAIAPADIRLPLPETSSSTYPRRVNSASVRNRSRLRLGFIGMNSQGSSQSSGAMSQPLAEKLLEYVEDSFRCRIAVTQEIEIARAAKRLVEPRHQQHRPFQNETVGVAGLREPVEQALDRIVRQDQIEILALLLADPKEAGANRGPDIPDLPSHSR